MWSYPHRNRRRARTSGAAKWLGAALLGVGVGIAPLPRAAAQIGLPPLHPVPRLRLLNGTADSFDAANAVAVDGSGNFITAGESSNVGTDRDFTVRKYAPSGAVLWTAYLDGTASH